MRFLAVIVWLSTAARPVDILGGLLEEEEGLLWPANAEEVFIVVDKFFVLFPILASALPGRWWEIGR